MSKQNKRPVLGGRYNEKTGELEFYEMTDEEAVESIQRFIDNLPKAKPITPEMLEAEAARGSESACKFLAGNPSQEEIQEYCQWMIDEEQLVDGKLFSAYGRAFREVLRPHLI